MIQSTIDDFVSKKGRPIGSGKLKDPNRKATVPAKFSPQLVRLLDELREDRESYCEIIMRVLET